MNVKSEYSADYLINWYLGNFINNPNNLLRDEDAYFNELEENRTEFKSRMGLARRELEGLRLELKGRQMTHKYFMQLVKERGLHARYYKYGKYEDKCEACRLLDFG